MDDMFPNSLSGLTPDLDKSIIMQSAQGEENSFSHLQYAMGENGKMLMNSPFSDESFGAGYENIFVLKNEEHSTDSTASPKAAQNPIEKQENCSKKRLNDLDGNILVEHFSRDDENQTAIEKFFRRFLPAIYKKKVVSEAISELTSLSKIANEIITKQIPYGEQDATYDDLITYLSSASSIHAKLKKKF